MYIMKEDITLHENVIEHIILIKECVMLSFEDE